PFAAKPTRTIGVGLAVMYVENSAGSVILIGRKALLLNRMSKRTQGASTIKAQAQYRFVFKTDQSRFGRATNSLSQKRRAAFGGVVRKRSRKFIQEPSFTLRAHRTLPPG